MRGGGHDWAGRALCEGIVVDLSGMSAVIIDADNQFATISGGARAVDVSNVTDPLGLAAVTGSVGAVGMTGLTLGGGIGYLTRRYGLTIDNLLSVDVVLADGSFMTASSRENSDLFWALRGGGGNFGVVTSFEFRLHPVSTVQFGPTFWPLEEAGTVLRAYRDFIKKAPEHVSGYFAFLTVPPAPMFPAHLHLKKVCGIVWCSTGTPEQTEAATKPMRSVGHALLDQVGTAPFPVVQRLFDGLYVGDGVLECTSRHASSA